MSYVLVDEYDGTYTADFPIGQTGGNSNTHGGMTYTPSATFSSTRIVWLMQKVGTPTGLMKCGFYAVSGDTITGSPLVESNTYDPDTLTTSFTWFAFDFPTPHALTNGVKVGIAIEMTQSLDASNYIELSTAGTGYAGGRGQYKNGGWGGLGGDMEFRVYKTKADVVSGRRTFTTESIYRRYR